MTSRLVIRLTTVQLDGDTAVACCLFDREQQLLHEARCALSEVQAQFAGFATDFAVTVIVPAHTVLLIQVQIPSSQARHIRQALPFMVEEAIGEDIENVHMATADLATAQSGLIDVAVISHSRLIHWLDVLHQFELAPDCMLPEMLCLPWQTNSWTVLQDSDQCLLRHGLYAGLVVATPGLPDVLRLLDSERDASQPKPLLSLLQSGDAESTALDVSALDMESRQTRFLESLDVLLASEAVREVSINLLQGGYRSRTERAGGDWRQWRPAAIAASVVLTCFFATTLGSGFYFSGRADQLADESRQLYRELFPAERRVVSPRKQMENHLRGAGGGGNPQFLALLTQAAGTLNGNSGVAIDQLRFTADNNALQMEVRGENLDQLEQFKQLLAQSGLQVDINSAKEQDKQVVGRMVVKGS